jgi:hypothetical protein
MTSRYGDTAQYYKKYYSNTMNKDEVDTEAQAAAAAYPVLTKEIVKEILESEPPYTNDDEKEACRVRSCIEK